MDHQTKHLYSPLPKMVTNSIYSFPTLHSSMNAPPMSAPPFNNFSAFGNNIGNTNKRADRDEQKQIFFGSNFDMMSPNLQSSSHLLDSGGNSALIGGSSGDRGKRANSTDSLNDLTDHFDSFFNFHSPPLFVPQSAPPFHLSAPPAAASNNGLNQQQQQYIKRTIYGHGRPPPHKINQPSFFSLKVFLGGLPANLTTSILQLNFVKYGKNFIDWPKKTPVQDRPPNGYAFVVFDDEQSIIQMLRNCQTSNNHVFFPIYTLNGLMHPIEIKVWEMTNTLYANHLGWRKFRSFSVFVGGIPRTCTALMLTMAVEEVIGPVAYCAIELDQYHFYPKGAACVVFTGKDSYIKAIAAHDVMLSFGTFERNVEFKAFLASNMPCEKCGNTIGTRFCQEMVCLSYYCQNCWKMVHSVRPSMSNHQPSKRHVKGEESATETKDADEWHSFSVC